MVLAKRSESKAGIIATILTLLSYWKLAAVIALGLFISAWLWHWYSQKADDPVGTPIVATEAPALSGSPTELITPEKPIKVRSGQKVKRELHLSDSDVKNEAVSIIAASRIKSDSHPVEVITKINKATGETETVVVRQPLPWFEFRTNGSIGGYAGITDVGEAGMIQVKQSVFSIKSLEFGFIGNVVQPIAPVAAGTSAVSDTRFFAGFGAEYKW